MRATILQQLLGLVLVLVAANAQVHEEDFDLDDGSQVRPGGGNWTLDPRGKASGTFSCDRRPRKVKLNSGDVATFSSPGWPSEYGSKEKCGWKFRAASKTDQITITCSSFTLQPSRRNRCKDYLSISSSTLKKKYCGTDFPGSVTVSSSVSIKFKTDKRHSYPGFTCTATVGGSVVTDPPATTPPVTNGGCVCGLANPSGTRIVGGQTTQVYEYPWQVALVGRGSSSVYCGGSLINDRWVLTAAHCTQNGVSQVLLGNHFQSSVDSAERRIDVRRVVDHPNYNSRTLNNDFSLLELSTTLDLESLDPQIRPVCLPTSSSNPSQYENVDAIVSGWGTTSSGGFQPNALQDTTVRTESNAVCNRAYGGAITDAMICARWAGRDSCQGDSGGPLVRDVGGFFRLIGVVSWGSGCADSRYPGVYARVTDELDWITQTSSSGTTCAPPVTIG